MYTIYTPNENFEGERNTVHFHAGKAKTDDPAIANELERMGYRVTWSSRDLETTLSTVEPLPDGHPDAVIQIKPPAKHTRSKP